MRTQLRDKKRFLGVIPARGGSKRLPRKNIKRLSGRPLVDYTIKAASCSRYLTDTVFSTDDIEIRDIAIECGAFAPFIRPADISGDDVRNSSTMIHALEYMEELTGNHYDAIVLLQPTSPFRGSYHIDEAIEKYIDAGTTTLAAVKGPFKKRDINLKRMVGNGRLENLIHENEEYFIYNASIYIVSRDWLLEERRFTSENEVAYVMDDESSIDVDTNLDFIMAEALIKYKSGCKI